MFTQRRWEDRPGTPEVILCFGGDSVALTRLEIARRLGISKGRYLIDLLEDMASSGLLIAGTVRLANGVDAITYRLPENG